MIMITVMVLVVMVVLRNRWRIITCTRGVRTICAGPRTARRRSAVLVVGARCCSARLELWSRVTGCYSVLMYAVQEAFDNTEGDEAANINVNKLPAVLEVPLLNALALFQAGV